MTVGGPVWYVVIVAHVAYPFERYEEAAQWAKPYGRRAEVAPVVYEWPGFEATRTGAS